MSITCRAGESGRLFHQHETVHAVRAHWESVNFPQRVATPAPVVQPTPIVAPVVETPAPERRRSYVSDDPLLAMITGMVQMIPEGYYATAPNGENGHCDFVRIHTSKSRKSRYYNSLVIQTQHSDKWEVRMVLWSGTGKWSVYSPRVIDYLMEIVSDYKSCGIRYAVMLKHCMRCNKELTDDRSRHYLVGPECETKHKFNWPVLMADELNEKSFETLRHLGLPYNQHHPTLGAA